MFHILECFRCSLRLSAHARPRTRLRLGGGAREAAAAQTNITRIAIASAPLVIFIRFYCVSDGNPRLLPPSGPDMEMASSPRSSVDKNACSAFRRNKRPSRVSANRNRREQCIRHRQREIASAARINSCCESNTRAVDEILFLSSSAFPARPLRRTAAILSAERARGVVVRRLLNGGGSCGGYKEKCLLTCIAI